MAAIPTLLYYFALFLMVEIDARKYGMRDVDFERVDTVWNLSKRYWFHFLSLVSIVVFMLLGFSPVLLGVLGHRGRVRRPASCDRDCALFSYDLFRGKRLGQGACCCIPASPRRWRAARSACSTSPRPAPAPASSSAW